MTEVLNIPRDPDGTNLYNSGLRRSPPSSSSLFLDTSPAASLSSSPRLSYTPPGDAPDRIVTSPPSSLSSSPVASSGSPTATTSTLSTPASSGFGSFDDHGLADDDDDDDFNFPNYGGSVKFITTNQTFDDDMSDNNDEPVELSTTTDTTRSDSPLPTPTVSDDSAVQQEPSRHVDYLSHDWREEDIWSSWRHIVSQRKVYGQKSRLENASWRTWAKSKYKLATISPETLNWLKESDVTWLYGPLKPASSHPITQESGSQSAAHLSKSNSFVHKKPILKKRSVSEAMLQKSLSTTSLVKQAAASAQAQRGAPRRRSLNDRPGMPLSRAPSEVPSRDQMEYFTSRSSSETGTPCDCAEKKHIRFDETVEQCIAIECINGEFDEDDDVSDGDDVSEGDDEHAPSDSSSDDGLVMMRRKKRPALKSDGKPSRSSSYIGRKIIETLPATKLKSRTDSPDVTEEARHHTFGKNWSAGRSLSPSPSQETLRPSNPSKNFLLPDEDDDEAGVSSSWSFGASNPKSSLGASASNESLSDMGTRKRKGAPTSPIEFGENPEGMRRTPSGMFMPYDEDEDDAMAVGLFGRVSETINTARDIAHVIWNVGWRK